MIVWLALWTGCLVEWKIVSTFALANEQECFVFPSADAQGKVVGDFSPIFCGKGNFLYLCKTNAKKLALQRRS